MSLETDPDPIDATTEPVALPFPTSVWGRVLYGLFITLLPAICFWATDLFKPEWQNGEFNSYVILFLFPQASLVFILLLAYSVICYLCLMFAPQRFAHQLIIRVGIYTGILLALQYSIVVLIYSFNSFAYIIVLIWLLPFVLPLLYRLVVSNWTAVKVNRALLILVLAGLLIGGVITRGSLPILAVIGLAMAAPFWSFLLALRAGVWLYKNHETKLTLYRGLGLMAWLAAYAAAWRYDILKMFELYAALPPQPPPDCYIATAAAQGHPRVVGSRLVQRADGKSMQVNGQLQVLKFAELALLAVKPRWHTALRKIYDVVGESLARRIHSPYLADIAYFLLKPFEWLARWLLKMIVPEVDALTEKIYT
jgi:hypothetical protein